MRGRAAGRVDFAAAREMAGRFGRAMIERAPSKFGEEDVKPANSVAAAMQLSLTSGLASAMSAGAEAAGRPFRRVFALIGASMIRRGVGAAKLEPHPT